MELSRIGVRLPHGVANAGEQIFLAIIAGSLQRIADVMEDNSPAGIARRMEQKKRDLEDESRGRAIRQIEAWLMDKPACKRVSRLRLSALFVITCGNDADPNDKANWLRLAEAKGLRNFSVGTRRAVREWIDKVFPQ